MQAYHNLWVVSFLKLQGGGQHHECSPEDHVRRFVEEVVVQLCCV